METEIVTCRLCASAQQKLFEKGRYGYFECGTCDLVSTYPVPTEQDIIAHYKRKFNSGNYALSREYAEEYKAVYVQMADELETYLASMGQSLKQKSVLDIGCFTGVFLGILKERGADVYGLELQKEAVDIANVTLDNKVFQGDVLSENIPKMKFDIVTMLGVIEHVPMPEKLLQRATDLLSPTGVAMIQTPNSTSFLARCLSKYWPPYAPVEHIHLFGERTIKNAFAKLGYADLKVKAHWKKLVPNYVFAMMDNFGPELKKVIAPIYKATPNFLLRQKIPFYGGEMLVFAKKNASSDGIISSTEPRKHV